jgi:hypothetical protein
VVVVTDYTNTPGNIRPWVDENGVDYPAAFSAPEVVGFRFTKRGRK